MRPHPVYILYDAKKWIPLLALWLIRQWLKPDPPGTAAAFGEIGWPLLLFAFSVVRWVFARYTIDNRGRISLTRGVFLRRQIMVMPDDTSSVTADCTLLMWLTRSRRLWIHTAGIRRRADAILFLPLARASRLLPEKQPLSDGKPYCARIWPILLMAATGSNIAFGLLTLAPALYQAADLAGSTVAREIPGILARVMHLGIPPLLNTLAGLLIWGWLLSFCFTAARYLRFTVSVEQNRLLIRQGLVTEHRIWIAGNKITALELRQTVLMRLLSLYTVSLTAAGFGRQKGMRPVLIPAARLREISAALQRLLPDYPLCNRFLQPRHDQLPRYIIKPAILISAGICLLFFGGFLRIGGFGLLAAGVWWTAAGWSGFRAGGFGVTRAVGGYGAASIRYVRGLTFCEVHIPLEVADCILLRQSRGQRRRGICSAEIRCFDEQRRRHRIAGLPYEAAKTMVEQHYTAPFQE